MRAMHGIFILPAKDKIKKVEVVDENEKTL